MFFKKVYRSNFIEQHSETVMVWNYRNTDCSYCVIYHNFRHIFVPMRALVMTVGKKQQKIPWCLKTALFCAVSVYRASLHGSGVLVTTTTQQGVGESHYRGVRTPQRRTVIHNNTKTYNVNFRFARRQRKPKFKRLLKVHVHFAAGCTTGWTKRFEYSRGVVEIQLRSKWRLLPPTIHIGLNAVIHRTGST